MGRKTPLSSAIPSFVTNRLSRKLPCFHRVLPWPSGVWFSGCLAERSAAFEQWACTKSGGSLCRTDCHVIEGQELATSAVSLRQASGPGVKLPLVLLHPSQEHRNIFVVPAAGHISTCQTLLREDRGHDRPRGVLPEGKVAASDGKTAAATTMVTSGAILDVATTLAIGHARQTEVVVTTGIGTAAETARDPRDETPRGGTGTMAREAASAKKKRTARRRTRRTRNQKLRRLRRARS